MKRLATCGLAAIAALALGSATAFADAPKKIARVGLMRSQGVNVDEGHLKAIGYLIRTELQKRGADILQADAECDPKDPGCMEAAGKKAGTSMVLAFRSVGYGDEIMGELFFYDAENAGGPKSSKLDFKKDELEIAAPRMVTAALEDRSIEGTVTSQNITLEESKAERYFESRGYWHAGIGGGYGLSGFNSGSEMLNFQGGYGHRWKRLSFEARSGFSFSPSGSSVNWNLMDIIGRYHFTDASIAPFAGAMAGIHYLNRKIEGENILGMSNREGRWGMAAGISGGVTFFRHLKMNMPVEVRYQHSFIEGKDANEIYVTVGFNF